MATTTAGAVSPVGSDRALRKQSSSGEGSTTPTTGVPSATSDVASWTPPPKDAKITKGANGAVLEDVPHLTDWLPDLESYENPLKSHPAYRAVKQYFVEDDHIVAKDIVVKIDNPGQGVHFRRAGPRQKIYFKSDEVRACVVTCGGLCPGLNTVIREIVCGLWTQYNVQDILGIESGYRGFYSRNTRTLTPKAVNDIHKRGGTILGTSRGGSDINKIVNSIIDRGINQVYIIGGDGTQKGVNAIYEELRKRNVKVAVAGIPKTIDNDVAVIDKSFGFDSAVEEAQRAIDAAHTEAESAENGIGVVKLMGRYSGYIAMYATLASRDVDCCLIPEVPFYLEGEGGLYEFAAKRLKENGHMVIVVAEGAGQELMALSDKDPVVDPSGNKLLKDIGPWLSNKLKEHFTAKKETINLKYIDPTYMIRAIRSNASDNVYCTLLAHSAIHGAMAGYTGFTVGPVNNRHAYIPIHRVTETQRHVNVSDRMWARLLSSTNQPDFLQYVDKVAPKKKRSEDTNHRSSGHRSRPVTADGNGRPVTADGDARQHSSDPSDPPRGDGQHSSNSSAPPSDDHGSTSGTMIEGGAAAKKTLGI